MNSRKQPLPIDAHIGSRIRLRRMMLGMSQERLGESCDVTFQQIQKYEKGVNRVGGSRLAQIATVLKVPVSFFFDDLPGGSNLVDTSADPDASDRVMMFLRSREGLRLNRAFANINSARQRMRLVALAESMAGVDSPDEVA